MSEPFDILVVGGGVNGAAIARDAAGRGFKVLLAERDDLASGTSQASSKLIHGGLRYLEHHAYRLVRESLKEREILMRAAPHLVRPLTFVLPWTEGQRPIWMLRAGLFLYDRLGGRRTLAGSRRIRLRRTNLGRGLQNHLTFGFTYSDCRVDDARFVVAMAMDAARRGATVETRTEAVGMTVEDGLWQVDMQKAGQPARSSVRARIVVNATGVRVAAVAADLARIEPPPVVRLVKGSHIVVPRVHAGDHGLILQNRDGRVVFVLPFEDRFSLIGTTDTPIDDPRREHEVDDEEVDYLLRAVAPYLKQVPGPEDVVWSFAGTRPLRPDGTLDPATMSRDYVLELGVREGAPMLSVIGGKITTARRLAEAALERLEDHLPKRGARWTARAALPGGDIESFEVLLEELAARHPGLSQRWLGQLARRHGSRCSELLDGVRVAADLGRSFGGGLTEREVAFLRDEWVVTADDLLWRRTKCGLSMTPEERADVAAHLAAS